MIGSYKLESETRNAYVRYLVTLLAEKYHVTQSSMALNVGFKPSYLRDFKSGLRNLGSNNLDKLEDYLTDLYEGLLETEIPQDEKAFLEFVEKI